MPKEMTIDLESEDLAQPVLPARDEFRVCYQPGASAPAGTQRHWLLDVDAGRDLLKVAARKYAPEEKVPLFGNDAAFDPVLDAMIDRLGLRDLKEPETALGMTLMNYKLTGKMLRVQLSLG